VKSIYFLFFIIFFLFFETSLAQQKTDSLSVKTDSLSKTKVDSVVLKKKSADEIKNPITYFADDSMMFSIKEKKIFLYGKGQINTEGKELKADQIEIDMGNNTLTAQGSLDSAGKPKGLPVFKDGGDVFEAKTLKYNYKTRKGMVNTAITEQSGGFVHSDKTKLYPDKTVYVQDAKYTTCNLDHPHFYVKLTKAKIIPGKRIISGPLYFVLCDVPVYALGLPFGYFPNNKKNTSGILIPTYGEEDRKGFYLRNFGYYLALNDYIDLTFLGEMFTYGSWGATFASNFKKRYKYSGNINIKYTENVVSEEGLPDFAESTSFWVKGGFSLDQKAIPNSNLSASLDFGTSNYRQYNATNIRDYTNNTASSSIAYNKVWAGTPFNFSSNLYSIQNITQKSVSLTLPDMNFNMSRISPFERNNRVGKMKWYEKINVSFSSQFRNTLETGDSTLFTQKSLDEMKYGFAYQIPIGFSFKMLKYLNVNPSFSWRGRIYPSYIEKKLFIPTDTLPSYVITDTVSGLRHNFDFGFSMPFGTTLYGMMQFFKGKVKLRHVMNPSISFNYAPDFGESQWGNYKLDPQGNRYGIYSNGIFGMPPQGKMGSIGFSLGNNFEMKVKSKSDTVEGYKKIKIFDNLNFSTSYNLAADSLRWSPLSVTGNTVLFNWVNLSFNASFEPYAVNHNGLKINTFEYEKSKKWFRLTNAYISGGFSVDNTKLFSQEKKNEKKPAPQGYIAFNVPWSLSFDYSISYSNTQFVVENQDFKSEVTQNLRFSGNLSLTQNWRISFSSGYDFDAKDLTSTSISVYRDLHCWEMNFTVIPFGTLRSYSFRINIKSAVFQGIEYKKDKSWHDNF